MISDDRLDELARLRAQGMGERQVAQHFGCSRGAVRTALARLDTEDGFKAREKRQIARLMSAWNTASGNVRAEFLGRIEADALAEAA